MKDLARAHFRVRAATLDQQPVDECHPQTRDWESPAVSSIPANRLGESRQSDNFREISQRHVSGTAAVSCLELIQAQTASPFVLSRL